jgi:trehalose 6-phosphate phosphatase
VRNLLGRGCRDVVRGLAASRTLLILDFDGTLAPIVRHPGAARLPRRTREVLAAVASLYPVAILSGRSIADVRRRLDGVRVDWVVGNHGAEWPGARRSALARRRVEAWRRALERSLSAEAGIEVEDKRLSLSIHWRRASEPYRAGAAALRAALRLRGAQIVPGKKVLNVVPVGAPDKGTAVRRLAREARCIRLLFVGDDVTDEAAFRERLPHAVMVRVGRSVGSAAPYFVGRRSDVDRMLEQLARLRAGGAVRERRAR